ncbi:hypothetical protein TSOC_013440, partial [Tetrabaena socialis]
MAFPEEPLRTMLIRALSKLGVGRLCKKYPAVRDALLKSVLETVVRYHRLLAGIEEEQEERERDANGQIFKTAAELQAEDKLRREANRG